MTVHASPAAPARTALTRLAGLVLIAAMVWLVATDPALIGRSAWPLALAALGGVLLVLDAAATSWRGTAGLILPYFALPMLLGLVRGNPGAVPAAVWLLLVGSWLAAIAGVGHLSALELIDKTRDRLRNILVAALFGAWIVILWEAIVVGFAVPFVLLPPPSAIGARFAASLPILASDFRQTFLKAVLAGYAIGCGAGFVVAVLADRVAFFRRGLLPIGNLVSALPIIGIAPIMVMWFGFDWQSKAAVVAVMTFFPMLVNTLAGLAAADRIDRDLMRTYAASYGQALSKLQLPAALPFIFNALKINSTLALIGAIVAEFFGTPIVGMGFRISTEVGRMNIDMVWAEIAVAAVAGSAFYGVMALVERAFTFWHPSFRT